MLTKGLARVNAELAQPIKEVISAVVSFGAGTVAVLLGVNKSIVQRIFQLNGWPVRKRPLGQGSRIEATVSRAEGPDQCRMWDGKHEWLKSEMVVDCGTRQFSGWHLFRAGKASTVSAALEQARTCSHNGAVFNSCACARLVSSDGL